MRLGKNTSRPANVNAPVQRTGALCAAAGRSLLEMKDNVFHFQINQQNKYPVITAARVKGTPMRMKSFVLTS